MGQSPYLPAAPELRRLRRAEHRCPVRQLGEFGVQGTTPASCPVHTPARACVRTRPVSLAPSWSRPRSPLCEGLSSPWAPPAGFCPPRGLQGAQAQSSSPAWLPPPHVAPGRHGRPGATLLPWPQRGNPERPETSEAVAICTSQHSGTGALRRPKNPRSLGGQARRSQSSVSVQRGHRTA